MIETAKVLKTLNTSADIFILLFMCYMYDNTYIIYYILSFIIYIVSLFAYTINDELIREPSNRDLAADLRSN